jgi:hypothetical protein
MAVWNEDREIKIQFVECEFIERDKLSMFKSHLSENKMNQQTTYILIAKSGWSDGFETMARAKEIAETFIKRDEDIKIEIVGGLAANECVYWSFPAKGWVERKNCAQFDWSDTRA